MGSKVRQPSLQPVQGRTERSSPAITLRAKSGSAMKGRAMPTRSAPESRARSMSATDRNPWLISNGTATAVRSRATDSSRGGLVVAMPGT